MTTETDPHQPATWVSWCEHRGISPGPVDAIGFKPHWRRTLARFVQGVPIRHVSRASEVKPGHLALIWGNPTEYEGRLEGLPPQSHLVRVEDGFLRSVGLGAHFAPPLSWVFDSRGLYFDATRPSDLEHILQNQAFSDVGLQRAQQLIHTLSRSDISKYNVGGEPWQRPDTDRQVILVPGQVESDASIAWGSRDIRSNLGLLQAVRAQNPQAWIIYKPHPDVLSGARARGQDEHQAQQVCDQVIGNASITRVIAGVDSVHTLTSLAGFEALLRGRPVHCYGMPFYAGWGLTQDQYHCERRQRRLNLQQLVAGALIHYPLYTSRTGQGMGEHYATPEQTLATLEQWRTAPKTPASRLGEITRRAARRSINRLFGTR
ncbi:hypothetical protein MLC59_09010 [Marinobacter bryozoorum]|uniref:capsular polysaccharide export protein, LipB/KpsS family n=1 Tax=Marinobacter bryozoorum TaxID=256324 RepID=UPI0020059BCB|nr:hypothetical protein [Marinobacter bryozoorum]